MNATIIVAECAVLIAHSQEELTEKPCAGGSPYMITSPYQFRKERFAELLQAAEVLSGYKNTPPEFKKLFKKRRADEWIESLDELFHHAVYDGLFTSPRRR